MVKNSLFVMTADFPPDDSSYSPSGDIEETVRIAEKLGYQAVEIQTADPEAFDSMQALEVLTKHSMEVSAINSGGINYVFDISLVNADRHKEERAFQMMKKIVEHCSTLKCFAQLGVARGPTWPGRPISYFKDRLVEVVRAVCDIADGLGVTVVLEYTNRFEINTINNCAEALDIIERAGNSNLGLLIDTYHSYLEDPDVYQNILDAKDVVKHFHLHDSDRGPACASNGVLDFDRIFRALSEIGYRGYLSDGLLTTRLPEEQVQKSTRMVKEYIQKYGL